MSDSKKVFISQKSDRGLFVKFLKGKVSLSFWGDDEPNKIAFSNEEVKAMCEHILSHIHEGEKGQEKNDLFKKFENAYKEVKRRTPSNQNF